MNKGSKFLPKVIEKDIFSTSYSQRGRRFCKKNLEAGSNSVDPRKLILS